MRLSDMARTECRRIDIFCRGDGYKNDNHTNPEGFRHEAESFFQWAKSQGFLKKNFYILCGDRHWQYHAKHPSGFEEFSCGALVDANSRLGRKPGDPKSTDPEARIIQFYTQVEKSGGFMKITVLPEYQKKKAKISFTFFDEFGNQLYSHEKMTQ